MTRDYVVISTVQGQFAEGQVRSFLESHGIQTAVRGETLRTTHAIAVNNLGSVEILVSRDQEAEARELLIAADAGALRLADDGEEGTEAMEGTDSHGDTETQRREK